MNRNSELDKAYEDMGKKNENLYKPIIAELYGIVYKMNLRNKNSRHHLIYKGCNWKTSGKEIQHANKLYHSFFVLMKGFIWVRHRRPNAHGRMSHLTASWSSYMSCAR